MTSNGNGVHTVPSGNAWRNEVNGKQIGPTFERKSDAVGAGRLEAIERKTEHHIHNADGSIAEKNSYGNDPRDIPG